MNCSDFQDQVGAWALGALLPAEAAAMEAHLAEPAHEGCPLAVARARATVAELASGIAPVTPGPHVIRAIEARIDGKPLPAGRSKMHKREGLAWFLVAAAAAALLVVNDARVKQTQRADHGDQLLAETKGGLEERDRCLQELQGTKGNDALQRRAIALLEKASTRVITLEPLPGKTVRASAIVNLAEHRTIVLVSAMPSVADKDFELWVIRGKSAPIAAGFMHAAGEGLGLGEIDPKLLEGPAPDAFAISLEPLGGRPTPTEVLMVGALHG